MDLLAAKDLPCINDRCRTCMIRIFTGIPAVNIFERNVQNISIAEILHSFTALTFDANDQLPKAVCQLCYEKLNSFYQFVLYIENVDIKFKAELQGKDNLPSKDIMKNNLNLKDVSAKDNLSQENEGDSIKKEISEDYVGLGAEDILVGLGDDTELNNPCAPKCEIVQEFVCKICYKYFSNKGNYQRHIKKHSNFSQNIEESMFTVPTSSVSNRISHEEHYSEESSIVIEVIPPEANINSDDEEADNHIKYNLKKEQIETAGNEGTVCEICKTQFQNKYSMAAHMRKHVVKGRVLSCPTCGKVFRKVSHLKRHQLSGRKKGTKCHSMQTTTCGNVNNVTSIDIKGEFNCEICGQSFKTKVAKSLHTQTHVEKGTDLSQSTSSEMIKTEIEVERNYEIQDANDKLDGAEEGDIPCEICKKIFKSKFSLAAHLRKHTERKRMLSCSKCGKVFSKVSHVKRHELTHEEKAYKCSLCKKSFATRELFRQHLTQHNEAKVCPVCQKKFATKSTLNAHISQVHNHKNMYLCSYCGKKFDSTSNLNQHHLRHIGIKNWACSLCPKKFVSKGELTSHGSIHIGEKPHKCKQCNTAFTKKSSVIKHMKIHQGIKPFECDTCHKKFRTNYSLKTHYRIHTGEKPYVCEICTQAFTQSNDLVKHRRKHLGEKLFKCDHCTESFRLKTELTHHITQHYAAKLQQTDMAAERIETNAMNG
ncbi:zinc finger protein 260-like [Aricia agestis]|uniref:zinc finger protein 260-like n=1 Tax=Aricia agestis TaxID=91739 RepID=UPI001C206C44|nr:zinc finger protein 260-like [Aricia agestis]XP_041981552.1 zinc finger protein 260-like [Aricia agestis]